MSRSGFSLALSEETLEALCWFFFFSFLCFFQFDRPRPDNPPHLIIFVVSVLALFCCPCWFFASLVSSYHFILREKYIIYREHDDHRDEIEKPGTVDVETTMFIISE